MNKFILRVDPECLEISKHNSITGPIYFEIENLYFPERNWNDFIIVIINWWLISIINVLDKRSNEASLGFMDGPYLVKVKISKEHIHYQLIERGKLNKNGCVDVDFDRFFKNFLTTAQGVLQKCIENNWHTDEVLKLEDNLKIGWSYLG